MKIIKINRRYKTPLFTEVDDCDFEELNKVKWSLNSCGYSCNGNLGLMHRFINKTPDGIETDHRNMNRLDNQRHNLRTATQSQNNQNRNNLKGGSSRYKGVSWCNREKRWRVRIKLNGVVTSLGYFKNEQKAGRAYDESAKAMFGDFAKTNF